MAIYNIHAGHAPSGGNGACGAIGILDESIEDRKVKNEVIRLLRAYGQTVYDCTCDEPLTQNGVLNAIVKKCNEHNVDLDISIHLNSGRNDYVGNNSTGGVEVWGIDNQVSSVGSLICQNISDALGIANRGFKTTSNLYVLNKTRAKAILIECCFVDDKDDSDRWNPITCASAITQAIFGIKYTYAKPNAIMNNTTNTNVDYAMIKKLQDTIKTEEILKALEIENANSPICYQTHIEDIGWQNEVGNGQIAGTVGKNKELEALKIRANFDVEASAHISNIGWVDYGKINKDTIIGTVGQHKAIECLKLKGNFRYRVHIQNYGWSAWTKADGISTLGTTGQALHLEAIQIEIL
jgi:N-acetylmuramoyl-L-alanine amidase